MSVPKATKYAVSTDRNAVATVQVSELAAVTVRVLVLWAVNV
jgi:hypothetical protein